MMSESHATIGQKIGQAVLVAGAVTVVFALMCLALLVTLVLAPPLKRYGAKDI